MNDAREDTFNAVRDLIKRSARKRTGTVTLSPEVAEALESVSVAQSAQPAAEPPPLTATKATSQNDVFDQLRAEALACTKCPLSTTRTKVVFGAGNPDAEVVFVGEAPGQQEDQQGIPFVGPAGGLLTDIIEKGMKMRREDVYICNVLKCRPPDNRDPLPAEVEQCEPYLKRQLSLMKPKVICALGAHAARTLLNSTEGINRLRGRWHSYQGIPLRATYHPSYLLRCREDKRKAWEDIKEILKVLGGDVDPRAKD